MIIGNGTIARALTNREDRLYFASGVSNSSETRREEYEREKNLLLKQDRNRHLVYFSSLVVFYSDNLYAQHKRRMEKLVKDTFKHHCIMRLGNVAWGNNTNHLIPFIRDKIINGKSFPIQDVYRYPITLEEFLYWVDLIPDWSCEMNVPGTRMKVKDIVDKVRNYEL